MSFAKILTRDEMKNVMAGGGSCRVFVGGSWTGCHYDVEGARSFYSFDEVTGYCCASCGSEPFENADSC